MANITITIPDEKISEFKKGFLKVQPVPLDESDNPIMGENAWIKKFIKDILVSQYKAGKEELAIEQSPTVVDEDIIS